MKLKIDTDYLKRVAITVGSVVVSIGLMAYVSYHLWRSFTTEVETITASKSTVTLTEPSTGYIMREETLLNISVSGNVVSTVADGEKVGADDVVAKIYDAGTQATVDHIRELEADVALLTESLSDGTLTLYDTSAIDVQILSLMRQINDASEKNQYMIADSLKSELKRKLIKRSLMTSSKAQVENMISDLRSEISELTRSLGALRGTVYSPSAGYYYSKADGYEKIFTASSVESMTYESFNAMISSSPDISSASSAGKIVTDHVWYMGCVYDSSLVSSLKEGDKCTVSFTYNSDTPLEMIVKKLIKSPDNTKTIVIFSSDRLPTGFDFSRSQPVEIIKEEFTCFKIPVSALRIVDGIRGVYVLDGSRVYFKAVSVIAQYDDSYLLEISPDGPVKNYDWLALNDSIIVKGTGLYHGRTLS